MACSRQVTREEDASYSLMGILGVAYQLPMVRVQVVHSAALIRELFNTKKNVMDLFNRAYVWGEGLLPSSRELYHHRRDVWDYSDWGTSLDQYLPLVLNYPNPLGHTHPTPPYTKSPHSCGG